MKSAILALLSASALISGPHLLVRTLAQSAAQSPAPQSSAMSAETPEIRELQKIEDSWATALNNRDQYGLELVLSPLYVSVSSTGEIATRNQQIVALINQEDKTASTDARVITVRMLGDVAVANGTYSYTHKLNGGVVEEKGVFTHVFQRVHGNWLCLNAQRTAISQAAPSKSKAAKQKSQAELPFHIPIFSKGDKSDTDAPK
jgi:ketosteroid isomerase-like protein